MNNIDLKPVKGIDDFARKQFKDNHFIYYRRKGDYAECHCAECGAKYVLRAIAPEDPFSAAALLDTEKPERDKETFAGSARSKPYISPPVTLKANTLTAISASGRSSTTNTSSLGSFTRFKKPIKDNKRIMTASRTSESTSKKARSLLATITRAANGIEGPPANNGTISYILKPTKKSQNVECLNTFPGIIQSCAAIATSAGL